MNHRCEEFHQRFKESKHLYSEMSEFFDEHLENLTVIDEKQYRFSFDAMDNFCIEMRKELSNIFDIHDKIPVSIRDIEYKNNLETRTMQSEHFICETVKKDHDTLFYSGILYENGNRVVGERVMTKHSLNKDLRVNTIPEFESKDISKIFTVVGDVLLCAAMSEGKPGIHIYNQNLEKVGVIDSAKIHPQITSIHSITPYIDGTFFVKYRYDGLVGGSRFRHMSLKDESSENLFFQGKNLQDVFQQFDSSLESFTVYEDGSIGFISSAKNGFDLDEVFTILKPDDGGQFYEEKSIRVSQSNFSNVKGGRKLNEHQYLFYTGDFVKVIDVNSYKDFNLFTNNRALNGSIFDVKVTEDNTVLILQKNRIRLCYLNDDCTKLKPGKSFYIPESFQVSGEIVDFFVRENGSIELYNKSNQVHVIHPVE